MNLRTLGAATGMALMLATGAASAKEISLLPGQQYTVLHTTGIQDGQPQDTCFIQQSDFSDEMRIDYKPGQQSETWTTTEGSGYAHTPNARALETCRLTRNIPRSVVNITQNSIAVIAIDGQPARGPVLTEYPVGTFRIQPVPVPVPPPAQP